MTPLGIIGGTALTALEGFEMSAQRRTATPYGDPSAELTLGRLHGRETVFLPRHGRGQTVPPHRVNYRANIWALHNLGVRTVLAIACVGGIRADMQPGTIAVPDQLIDYTYGRKHTFFEDELERVVHADFTRPYSGPLRDELLRAAASAGISVAPSGTYGCTQGPRLETAAEIARMEKDGCAMVGMTGMPEASLARELEMDYVCCAVVANRAAGKGEGIISMAEITATVRRAGDDLARLLHVLMEAV